MKSPSCHAWSFTTDLFGYILFERFRLTMREISAVQTGAQAENISTATFRWAVLPRRTLFG